MAKRSIGARDAAVRKLAAEELDKKGASSFRVDFDDNSAHPTFGIVRRRAASKAGLHSQAVLRRIREAEEADKENTPQLVAEYIISALDTGGRSPGFADDVFALLQSKVPELAAIQALRDLRSAFERLDPQQSTRPGSRGRAASELIGQLAALLGTNENSARALLTSALQGADNVSQVRLPASAPELWQGGRGNPETPPEFVRRVYGEWLGKGLDRAHIRNLDRPLYQALDNWLRRH